jgi:hypothetical protein
LHGIEGLQTGNDFAARKWLNLEFVVGGFGNEFGHQFDATPEGIERFRPARRQAPLELRGRLRDRRRRDRCGTRGANTCYLQKIPAFHGILPFDCVCVR